MRDRYIYIIEDVYLGFLLLLQSKKVSIVGYMNHTKFHVFLIQSLFVRQLYHLLIGFVVVLLFVIILFALLTRNQNCLGSLRDMF